jgi:hypothetical protein
VDIVFTDTFVRSKPISSRFSPRWHTTPAHSTIHAFSWTPYVLTCALVPCKSLTLSEKSAHSSILSLRLVSVSPGLLKWAYYNFLSSRAGSPKPHDSKIASSASKLYHRVTSGIHSDRDKVKHETGEGEKHERLLAAWTRKRTLAIEVKNLESKVRIRVYILL